MVIRGWGLPLGIANPLNYLPIPISSYKSPIHFLKKKWQKFLKNFQKQFLN